MISVFWLWIAGHFWIAHWWDRKEKYRVKKK